MLFDKMFSSCLVPGDQPFVPDVAPIAPVYDIVFFTHDHPLINCMDEQYSITRRKTKREPKLPFTDINAYCWA